jgi:uridylate kinase
MQNPKLFVVSLGGSLIFPEELDINFLKEFKKLISKQTAKKNKFILITGGGKICRKYQGALNQLAKISPDNLDWMGIYTTHVNAQFVRLLFGNQSNPQIVTNPTKKVNFNENILLAAGWKPGWSTDMVAVLLAKTYGAKTVINLSNIDFLYTKDPRKFSDAEKITNISWKGLLKITGKKWRPGANVPFDPIAAQFAEKNKIQAIIANGKNLKNLENILNGKNFDGTTIS